MRSDRTGRFGVPGIEGGDQTTSSLRSLHGMYDSRDVSACPTHRFLDLSNERLEQMID